MVGVFRVERYRIERFGVADALAALGVRGSYVVIEREIPLSQAHVDGGDVAGEVFHHLEALAPAVVTPLERRQDAQHLVEGGCGDLDGVGFEGLFVARAGGGEGHHGQGGAVLSQALKGLSGGFAGMEKINQDVTGGAIQNGTWDGHDMGFP